MIRYKPHVMHLRRDGTIIADSSGWTIRLFGMWLARFGDAWRAKYPTTWAYGHGRDKVWFFTPKEKSDALR